MMRRWIIFFGVVLGVLAVAGVPRILNNTVITPVLDVEQNAYVDGGLFVDGGAYVGQDVCLDGGCLGKQTSIHGSGVGLLGQDFVQPVNHYYVGQGSNAETTGTPAGGFAAYDTNGIESVVCSSYGACALVPTPNTSVAPAAITVFTDLSDGGAVIYSTGLPRSSFPTCNAAEASATEWANDAPNLGWWYCDGANWLKQANTDAGASTVWNTVDLDLSPAALSDARPYRGPISGVSATVTATSCQANQVGSGAGNIYVAILDVTDGGATVMCADDFGVCNSLARWPTNPYSSVPPLVNGCAGFHLDAGNTYVRGVGFPTDGGTRCATQTTTLDCSTTLEAL